MSASDILPERQALLVSMHFYCNLFLYSSEIISLNFANSASVKLSPRTFAASSIFSKAFSTCAFEYGSSGLFAIPFCNVFLHWLKDARISLNIRLSSFTVTGGSSYLVSRITADPTPGLGIKQFGGTFAAIYGFA